MSNLVGSLLVKLGLDAAEYTSGLTKAEIDSQKFAKKVQSNMKDVAAFIGGLAIGATVGKFIHDTVSAASALDDLSDATGASVESLSKLSNQAKIAGVDFETLQAFLIKMSDGLAGIGDESETAARAFKVLGVTAKDPVEAMGQLSDALAKYKDGVNKIALLKDIGGKSGPGALPFLKDLQELKEVSGTTTTQMAADAEKLEKALRRITAEGTVLKDLVLKDLVPWLINLIQTFKDATRFAGDLALALQALANLSVFESAAQNVARLDKEINDLEATIAKWKSGRSLWQILGFSASTDTSNLEADLAKLKAARDIAGQMMLRGFGGGPTNELMNKPDAPTTPKVPKKDKKEVDEFAKAMEKIRDSLIDADAAYREAFKGEKIEGFAKALAKITSSKEFAALDEGAQRAIKTAGAEVIATEKQTLALDKEREAREKLIKTYEDLQKAQEDAHKDAIKSLGTFTEQNDLYEKQIGLLGKGEEAMTQLNAATESNRILTAAKLTGDMELVKLVEGQIARQKALISSYYETNAALQQQIEFNRIFADSFADAITSVVDGTKSISQAFKDMEKNIVQAITRIAAQKIANTLFGVDDKSGGGGIGALIGIAAKFLSGIGGGGATPNLSGIPNPSIGSLAGGTENWRGGPTWVGEHGPELLSLPRGAKVTPAGRAAGGISIVVNQAAGASRASAEQLAAQVGRQVQRAMRSVA